MHATTVITDPVDTGISGRHLPTEMSTGRSSRQMSTFPPGIRGTRMPTR